MEAIFKSDRGKVRQLNEDSGGIYRKSDGALLAVVADGMGGHRAGDVASKMTVEIISRKWRAAPSIRRAVEAEEWLKQTIEEINSSLSAYSDLNEECRGMGTTIVAALCTDEFVTVANVGDSRGYLITEERVSQITEDDSFVNALVQSGEISKQDAEHHPKRNVLLKALGSKGFINPALKTVSAEEGYTILLCSDGLSNKVSDQELLYSIKQSTSLAKTAEQLIDLANDKGGEDNITLAVIAYPEDEGGDLV
ncbi:Stp1/IreP family PP2C-type Ser/Thr phosphatase [Jeotgalibacillus aurantiacus]|uniref:Stp1/IreP family PP2C-type Ser/Thr phosphatase n=1 Tax=Jeotgalibacillus aurantiacus TaxID=2763266 RepID=UPI001D0AAE5D|nr:Stp1/IreP family PP2C-type Ser/Thr phosphatase [Jeotgalibacillus aurantiacus]